MTDLENTGQQTVATEEPGLTGQPEGQPAGDPGASTAQPQPDFEIKRDGQVVKVPYDKAGDYISKGYDYTQKTQELASQRETLKPYQEMADYLGANPEKAQEVYNLLNGTPGQEIDPVQQKMAQQDMVLNQLVQQNAKSQVDNMLGQINAEEKYEGLFKDKEMEDMLIATALQTKKMDMDGLRSVADKMHKKILGIQVKSQKAGEKKVTDNLASPTRKAEKGTGSFTPPAGFDPSKASWKELNKRAMEML